MLDKTDTHDVTVTEKMSQDMARPSVPAPPPPKKAVKRKSGLDLPRPALPDPTPLAAIAAQAPTAGGDSAGIGDDPTATMPVVPSSQGTVKSAPGPRGLSRRVRTIAPGL